MNGCLIPSAIKPIADKYDVSVKDMMTAIYLYESEIKDNFNKNDPKFVDFINNYFKISSTTDFDNAHLFVKASKIWKETDNGVINAGSNVDEKVLLDLCDAFGKDNVVNYINANGEWCIRVAQPTLNGYTQEMLDIKDKALKDGTFMKAPNGKPTNLNEKQWLQVRTKAFKDWFGDWENDAANASKVVDENGEPLVVYHGTKNGNFNAFDYEHLKKADSGFFFSSDKEYAKQFGDTRAFFLNIKNPNKTNIPLNLNSVEDLLTTDYIYGTDGIIGNDDKNTNENINSSNGQEYVALRPNQIKSATDNIDRFSKNNNDIRYNESDTKVDNNIDKDIPEIDQYFEDLDKANQEENYFDSFENRLTELAKELKENLLSKTTPRLKELFENDDRSTVGGLLANIANSNSSYAILAANLLNKIGELGSAKVYLREPNMLSEDGKSVAGLASTNNQIEISIDCNGEFADATILHEILHLIVINTNKSDEARKELSKIYNEIKSKILAKYGVKSLSEIKDPVLRRKLYGLTNEDEFISEFYINRDFKEEINTADQTFFQKVVNWLKKHAFKNRLSQEANDAIRNLLKDYNGTILNEEDRKFISQSNSKQSAANIGPETKINVYAGTNENADLSNFAERPFNAHDALFMSGETVLHAEYMQALERIGNFKTVEGAFQALKIFVSNGGYTSSKLGESAVTKKGYDILRKFANATGSEARNLGRSIEGLNTEAWDNRSRLYMKLLVKHSFAMNEQAAKRLLATGNATLTHTQDKGKWGTEFPKILMEVREELKNEHPELLQQAQPVQQQRVQTQQQETTRQKLDRLIAECKKRYKFNEGPVLDKNTDDVIAPAHSYSILNPNGTIRMVAEKTASSFKALNGRIDFSPKHIDDQPWGIPSTNLGSTVDKITRNFFNDKGVGEYTDYPNFTKDQFDLLISDLQLLKSWAGQNGITLMSADFPMVVKYNGELIGGSMDLIGYTEDGKIIIFDMKNKRGLKSETDFNREGGRDDYRGQQNLYRAMFNSIAEQLGIDLSVEDGDMKILHFKCKYPEAYTWEVTDDKQLSFVDTDTNERINIQDYKAYESPRLVMDAGGKKQKEFNISYVDAIVQSIDEQGLTAEEKELLFGTSDSEKIATNLSNQATICGDVEEEVELDKIDKQLNNLLASRIKSSDLSKLANNIMNTLSDIYDCVEQGDLETYAEILGLESVPEEGSEEYKAFEELKSLNRDQLIERLPLSMILDFIRKSYFRQYLDYTEADIEEYDAESQYLIKTMQTCHQNFEGLLKLGYSRLILLEQRTLTSGKTEEKDIINDGVQDTEQENNITLEETSNKDLEHWMVEQMAVKASLSKEWRRIIAKMPKLDESGNEVLDKFGFVEYMDENAVINNLLNWFKGCTTVEQMEQILEKKVKYHPEYQTILDLIKNDQQLRSKFFQNFRKDFQTYSIVMINYDENGKLVTSKKVINTCTATEFMLNTLGYKFATGFEFTNNLMHFDGEKRIINMDNGDFSIEGLEDRISKLQTIFRDKENFKNDEYIARLEDLLKDFGIVFPEKTVKQALDFESENGIETGFTKNFVEKILDELQESLTSIKNINKGTDNASKQKQKYNYSIFKENPEKGEISIRQNYKTILDSFEPYLENVIEASSYENGKMHYAFNPPSYTGKMMIKFADSVNNPNLFDTFIKEEYGQYEWFKVGDTYNCPILHMMTETTDGVNLTDFSKNARLWFSHKTQLSYNKTPYTELSAATYMHSILSEFFIDATTGNVRRAFYRVPIMSNKPTSEFISMPRFCGENYKDKLSDYYYMVFRQELMRMRTVLERAVNPQVETIKSYDLDSKWIKNNEEIYKKLKDNKKLSWSDLQAMKDSGASFKFLSYINDLGKEGVDAELKEYILKYINNEADLQDSEVINKGFEIFKEVHNKNMDSIMENQIGYMDSIGIFEVAEREIGSGDEKTTVPYYKYFDFLTNLPEDLTAKEKEEIAKKVGEKELKQALDKELLRQQKEIIDKALENFVWNDMLASINIIELTATDLAYYKNMEDFQKRFAQIHAPGLRLNTKAQIQIDGKWVEVSDEKSRTMYIKDYEINTGIERDVATAFDILIGKHPERKDALSTMKSVVSAALKGVNVADAQAFTSPTGMMKKLVMAGSWDDNMTKAYERICSGNFDLSDLQILIQPLKPFVYSQIKKNSYAQTMTNLKVGLQNKNSEYMILLADAIMRGAQQNNKLVALFDFMEASAYTGRTVVRNDKVYKDNVYIRNAKEDEVDGQILEKGVYNKHGIDTIQFESAVKVGLQGVVNLNEDKEKNNLNYDQIISLLHDRSQSKVNPGEYDDRYVHTFNYEDYAVQQEVPAHLKDHRQLLGSQERILTVSDIPFNTAIYFRQYDGKELKTVGEVVKRYQDLIAANIEDSFNELSEYLGLGEKNIKERNKILSELLKEEISKDARYGADMLVACTVDKYGNFNIPLSDPIQATRIQQLLHSIIKSRINKQKIAGGPVVQTSCWGVDNKYKIRFKDKNGDILDTFEEYGKSEKEYAQYLKDNDARLASFDCAMPVPTQELENDLIELAKRIDKAKGVKYNGRLATPQEAVGFGLISEEQLQAIGYRIPTEDKYSIYPMRIVEWVPRAAGEVIILPEEITKLTGSDFDIDKTYIVLKEFERGKKFGEFNEMFDDLVKKIQYKVKGPNDRQLTKGEAERLLIEFADAYNLNKLLNDKKPNMSLAKYSELKSIIGTESVYQKMTKKRAGRNNEIFDIQWEMLTHQDMIDKMFNPGSFDPQKKIAFIIQCMKNEDNKKTFDELKAMELDDVEKYLKSITKKDNNITYISTQVQFHQQNMVAGKLIGIFANNNVSHAFLQMQNIQMNFDPSMNIEFCGVNFDKAMKLDAIYARDNKTYISKNIAGFLAASVDAVKDPVLNHLNLNTYTTSVAMLLARLGFSVDQISLFLSQPILMEFSKRMANKNNDGYAPASDILEQMMYEIDNKWREHLKDHITGVNLDEPNLVTNLTANNTQYNFEILRTFYNLLQYTQALGDLTFITKFNSMSNAAGPTIADNIIMNDRIARFNDLFEEDDEHCIFNRDAQKILSKDKSPILYAFYKYTVGANGAAEQVFSPYFVQYTGRFREILEKWRETTKAPLDEKTINQLALDFLLFKLTTDRKGKQFFNTSPEMRNYLINDFPKEYWKTISENPELQENELIKIITLKTKNKKCPVDTLQANTGGFASDTQEAIKNAWTDLLESDNITYRALGRKLFYYCLMRNGFGFSPKTFIHLASVDVKLNMGYTKLIQDVTFNDFLVDINMFINQFKRNRSNNYRAVPKFKSKMYSNVMYKGATELTLVETNEGDLNEFLTGAKKPIGVIKVDNQLFQYISSENGGKTLKYVAISQLGNPNNFVEYNAEDYNMKSAVDNESFTKNLDAPSEDEMEQMFGERVSSAQPQDNTPESDVPKQPNISGAVQKAQELTNGGGSSGGIANDSRVNIPQQIKNNDQIPIDWKAFTDQFCNFKK